MCGEQIHITHTRVNRIGSPPRVRGTVLDYVPRVGVSGITPACAGNSFQFCRKQSIFQDHPRVCGEQRISGPLK